MFLYHTLSALLCVLFIPVILGVGESPSPQKKENLQLPQTAAKLCAVYSFLRPAQPITKISRKLNFLLMDNKLMKLFVIKQSKGCKFMPTCRIHQNTSGGRLRLHTFPPKVNVSAIKHWVCVRMQFVIGEEDDEATLEVYDNDNAFDDFLGRCFYPFIDRCAF